MEREGVAVWISWEQDEDEMFFCDVLFENLTGIEDKVYSFLVDNPAYEIERVSGWLSVSETEKPNIRYVVTIYGTYS